MARIYFWDYEIIGKLWMLRDGIDGFYYWFHDCKEFSEQNRLAGEGKEFKERLKFSKPFLKR
jgi:hypothetical protein